VNLPNLFFFLRFLSYFSSDEREWFTMQRGDWVTMQLRTMVKSDIAAGMRLKEIAGWNQTAEDWTRFLEASPEGCFVVEADGAVHGTAATITYEDKFAWVGMVLVDPCWKKRLNIWMSGRFGRLNWMRRRRENRFTRN
jgi:hypothetical protein